ncbi:winged helix-turn-helix transcriptional regulator [Nocardiopsis sp. HUAS JQ3]|uniref:winged helix-turn-helix transcriptional regulator n=1 Tax=Nocardiopsis sp. HUAS JQ3 TaxID=3061629 RepID=UPI0034A080EF
MWHWAPHRGWPDPANPDAGRPYRIIWACSDSYLTRWRIPLVDWVAAQGAVRILAGKWTLLVLNKLIDEPRGYNALVQETGLDTKTLSRCLYNMESTGLVNRSMKSERPIRVVYTLTPHSIRLLELLEEMADWKKRIN